jgi:hypothetical protein
MNWLVQRGKGDGTAVLGELFLNGLLARRECFTLEPDPPILAGTYDLIIDQSARFGRLMPHVVGVPPCPPDRGIRIHWGNWRKDTLDCTLVGETESADFVGHSVDEFNLLFVKLQKALEQGPVTITYKDYDPNLPSAPSGAGGGSTLISSGGTQ